MNDEEQVLDFKTYKRSKIIATVGPAINSYADIYSIIEAGADGLRLNFSHGSYEERTEQIGWIRKAAEDLKKQVAIIQDLQGPKIRLGDFDGNFNVEKGQALSFEYKSKYPESGHLPVQYDISKKIKSGETLYLFDGKIKTIVDKVEDGVVYATAQNSGYLVKRKGINLPDTDFDGDIVTAKDYADIEYGASADIDYVALSFVQTAEDIIGLRSKLRELGSSAKIIAKIETKAAIKNIESIVEATDAVMVARGDLAIETPAESVPVVQRQIVGLGQSYGKPTIIATQMLASMTDNPEPSRAEVSDVATAVFIGADCLMLSDETASGDYPLQSVKTMNRVIRYTESHMPLSVKYSGAGAKTIQKSIGKAIINIAEDMNATAIVAETKSGSTAVNISSYRPKIPIVAVTSEVRTAQQLAIVFGTKSYVRPVDPLAATKLTQWLRQNDVLNKGDIVVSASGRYPGVVGTTDTIKVRVLE